MAEISITWSSGIIYVPKDCPEMELVQLVPTVIYSLDLDAFRLKLKSLEDDPAGMPHNDTHRHNTEVTLAGLTFARVIEILSPYTVTFEDDQYAVNLVGANSNVADRLNVNQVSVRSQNSAGLISTPLIEYSSFDEGVSVDVVNGTEGTVFPAGTKLQPVKTTADALLIAAYRGFEKFYVVGDITLDTGTDFSGSLFIGESPTKSTITIDTAANVTNCEFYDAEVTGVLDGGNVLLNCLIINLNYVNGYINQCIIGSGTITLGGALEAHFLDCWSGVVGSSTPIIDMGGSGQGLGMRNYVGGIKLINKSGSEKVSIDLASGQAVLDNTVTNGEIVVRGDGKLIDTSGDHIYTGTWNGCTIINETSSALHYYTWDEDILGAHTGASGAGYVLQDARKKAKLAANKLI